MALRRDAGTSQAQMADFAAPRYGPNWPIVLSLIDDVRRLSAEDGTRIRRAYLENETPLGSGAATRAEVTGRVVQAAVKARRADQRRQAIEDCRQALGGSRANGSGMGVHLGDLAGALVVRELLTAADVDFVSHGWREAIGEFRSLA